MTVHLADIVHAVRPRRLSQCARRGNLYLVDVGTLVIVAAASPADAYAGARFSCQPHFITASPRIYRVDTNGKVVAVFE